MTPTAKNPNPTGLRDCGRFFLDVVGQYPPDQVVVRWSDDRRTTNERVDRMIEKTWVEQLVLANQSGCVLFDGPLCRLIETRSTGCQLTLTLGPVTFKEFMGTNLFHPRLRHFHGPEIQADPVGVSAAVVSSDGYILLGRRSSRVLHHAGKIHPVGGMMEPDDASCAAPPSPFRSMLRELHEEAGVSAGQVHQPLCLGIVREKRNFQPELIFDLTVDVDAKALLRQAGTAEDASEHTELLTVRDDPIAVVDFVEQYEDELTPVAAATLFLHGLRLWGSGWLTSARGYLGSVI